MGAAVGATGTACGIAACTGATLVAAPLNAMAATSKIEMERRMCVSFVGTLTLRASPIETRQNVTLITLTL